MTKVAREHYNVLYDELETLVRSLVDVYDTDRGLAKHEKKEDHRRIDPAFLIHRAKAINDCANELRFLELFNKMGLVN